MNHARTVLKALTVAYVAKELVALHKTATALR
jgi:hypothetical protein